MEVLIFYSGYGLLGLGHREGCKSNMLPAIRSLFCIVDCPYCRSSGVTISGRERYIFHLLHRTLKAIQVLRIEVPAGCLNLMLLAVSLGTHMHCARNARTEGGYR